MKEISVSNDNITTLLTAEKGEDIIITHIGSRQSVKLIKVGNFEKPRRMTLAQIEMCLGYPVEIID